MEQLQAVLSWYEWKKKNKAGEILKEELIKNVLEVSDMVVSLKLEAEVVKLNVVSGYAPKSDVSLRRRRNSGYG